jgi:hypothetical protein
MQMSAPNVALYAVTIMAQPSFEEENPDINQYQRLHRKYYLPFMSFLFGLCLLGAAASIHSLVVRWHDFRKLPFSPAHAAFCAPSLSHCNAVQAYRAAVLSFSGLSNKSYYLQLLYSYWIVVLIGSTVTTLLIATRFLYSLPKWTHFDLVKTGQTSRTNSRLLEPFLTADSFVFYNRKTRSSLLLLTRQLCPCRIWCRLVRRSYNRSSHQPFFRPMRLVHLS